MRRLGIFLLVGTLCAPAAMAKGRRPSEDEDKDNYPDYNRLEMHPQPKNSQVSSSSTEKSPVPAFVPPALNTPANAPAEDDSAPKAPPKAVPVPDDSSEPPLPEDINNTLIPSTTVQK
jgi:hypothetical protein